MKGNGWEQTAGAGREQKSSSGGQSQFMLLTALLDDDLLKIKYGLDFCKGTKQAAPLQCTAVE